jgi:hypothetical protein
MATALELVSSTPPYIFESLGVEDFNTYQYSESTLFPKETRVELTSGKFPLNDYTNVYKSNKTHVIGGKTVRIVAFTNECEEGKLNKYGNCKILVVADQDGGRNRRRSTRRSRSRRRRSTRRKQ